VEVAKQAVVNRARERHGVPALLSFFMPGLGQLVKGSVLRGIAIFVAMCLAVVAISIVVGIVIAPILWLWQLYDAYTAPDAATNRELDRLAGKK
jgi:TM2 domain-containing membrane protein YozV